jgi:organic hydroperoxide reductase OsmC/OhrA
MTEHHASLRWQRTSDTFTYDTYNRAHDVTFKSGAIIVPSSAAPAFKGDADRVDPEEAFVGSLASCHMLTFLAICARKRLTVDSYNDDAVGIMEKGSDGKWSVTRVTLRPRVVFSEGTSIDAKTLDDIHHRAHEDCFIANSVKTDVTVEQQR